MKKISTTLVISMVFFLLTAWNAQAGKSQLPNPVSIVNPDTVFASVNSCNDSVTELIHVSNTGTGPLLFSVQQHTSFVEDFEDGLGNWLVNSPFGIQDIGFGSDHSLSESPSGFYSNYMNVYATLKDSLLIVNKDSAFLTYDVKYSLECNYDYLYVQMSVNNGNWVNLNVFNCSSGWVHITKNFSSYVNNGDYIKIRFYFHSDYSVIADGTNIDNIVIKGVSNAAPWMSIPTMTGYLLPGESAEIQLIMYSLGLNNGTYNNVVNITTNDPLNPSINIPVYFTVNGSPEVSINEASLNFGSVMQYTTRKDTIVLENPGCGLLIVDSLYTGTPNFSVLTAPFSLVPGQSKQVIIEFGPDTAAFYQDALYLVTNDLSQDPQIPVLLLEGDGTGAPLISTDTQSFSVDLNCGDSVSLPITIYNSGLSDLFVRSNFNTAGEGLILYYPMDNNVNDLSGNNLDGVNYNCTPVPDRFNFPNNALYFDGTGDYIDVPDGVFFDGDYTVSAWVNPDEIRSWSRLIDFANGQNNNNILVSMSQNMTGYFTNEVYNNSNSGGYTYCASPLPLNTWTMVTAVLEGSNIKIYLNGQICTSSYTSQLPQNVVRTMNYIGRSNWAFDSYYKGKIDDLRIYDAALDETEVYSLFQSGSSFWLMGQQLNDTIHPGQSLTMNITVNAANLVAGTYNASINLQSNDPLHPQLSVPVLLNVTGFPQVNLPENQLDFGSIMQNTSTDRYLTIKNTGCDVLHIDELNINGQAFSVGPDFSTDIVMPHDSLLLNMVFAPQDTGLFTGILTIYNNDEVVTVTMQGYATPAPVLGWSPDTLSLIFEQCDDSLSGTVTIFNNGLLDLEWSANPLDDAGSAISFNGIGQQVDIGNFGEMPEQGTIEFWQWTNELQNYNNSFCTNGFGSNSNIGIRFEEDGSGLFGVVYGNDLGNYYGFTVTEDLPVNSWHHIATTWNKVNNSVSIYFDGEAVSIDEYCPTWATQWTNMMIGTGWADWRWWNGKIDEFRIWAIPKNQEQIQEQMYQSLNGTETGLIAYWDFNETEGETVYDRSNNGHDGTFSGATRETSEISITNVFEISPSQGTITPGNSTDIEVMAWNTNLNAGSYLKYFTIYSNDPSQQQINYPVKIEVTGQPGMVLQDSLLFGEVMQYSNKTKSLLISNPGCDTLIIFEAIQNVGQFSYYQLPLVVLPKSEATLYVTFAPGAAVDFFTDQVILLSNADPFELYVSGNSYGAPQILILPTYFDEYLGCYDSITRPMDITNMGQSDLIFSFNPLANSSGILPAECTPQTTGYCCGMGVSKVILEEIDHAFVPGTGYQDLSATEVAHLQKGNIYTITLNTGDSYSENASVWIDFDNNGYFDEWEKILATYSVYYAHVAEFTIPDWCVMNVPLRMRVMSDYYFAAYPSPCNNLYYGQTIDLAVIVSLGVRLPEGVFTLAPGESTTKDIMFSGKNLEPGWYPCGFNVYSNDPLIPEMGIEAYLSVIGSADPTPNTNVLDFGDVMQYTTDTVQLLLSNSGCDTLVIYYAYTNDGVFELLDYEAVIPPGAAETMVVSFHPEWEGYYENYLYFETNGGNLEIQLIANVLLAPQIWLNVDYAEFYMWCKDSADYNIYLANDGNGDLIYSIVPDENSNSGILNNVTFSPQNGTITPGSGAFEINIHTTTTGLGKGEYTQYYNIISNDPFLPVLQFAVKIYLDGTPEIYLAQDCIHFGTGVQYTYTHDSLLVSNTGCDSLFIWEITTQTGNFYSNTAPFVLPAYTSRWVDVTFNPQEQGDMTDNMNLYTNTGDHVICLTGYCTPSPIIGAEPGTLNMVLSCQQTGTIPLLISNLGLADLVLTTSLISGSPWLYCDAVNITLMPYESMILDVYFDRGAMANGLYNGLIRIESNDPFHPVLEVPAYLLIPNQLDPVQLPSDTGYCAGGSIVVHAGSFASYLWNDGSTGAALSVTSPGTYYVDVVDIHNCTSSDTIEIAEFEIPQVTVLPDTALCANGTILLNGAISGLLPIAPVTAKIGNGTSLSGDTGPNPFGTYYMDHRVQMVYKRQELLEAGLSPGIITHLGIVVGNPGEPGLSNFNIKIRNSIQNTLSNFVDGMTQVYNTAYYHPHSGENLFELQSNFYWDGISNIIVEFCFDNNSWSYNSTYEYTSVTNSVFCRWCDNCAPGCALTGGSIYSQRANLLIHGDGDVTQYRWTGPDNYYATIKSPVITNAQLPQNGWYFMHVDNGFGCTGSDSMMVTVFPSPQVNAGVDMTFLQYDSVQLNASVTGGIEPYNLVWTPPAGLNSITVLSTMASPSSTTTYTLNVTGDNQCASSDQLVLTVIPRFSISGQVVYNNAYYTALAGVKVVLENQNTIPVDSTYTNETGNYTFPLNVNGIYNIHATSGQESGGVNSTDALQICRHITFLQSLGGLRLTAADVNANQNVSSADALLVLHKTVGNITAFPAGEWQFERKHFQVNGGNVYIDFYGLSTGDVNGSFIPLAKASSALSLEYSGEVFLAENEVIDLPVYLSEDADAGALTLVINYPADAIEITGVSSNLKDMLYSIREGTIKIGWNSIHGAHLDKTTPLLYLHIIRRATNLPDGYTQFYLGDESELADPTGVVIPGKILRIPVVKAKELNNRGFELYQNRPNPFSQTSEISFYLPGSGMVELALESLQGDAIQYYNLGNMAAGYHNFLIDCSGLANGMYIYRMKYQAQDQKLDACKKLLINR
jgi:hypothetical protein